MIPLCGNDSSISPVQFSAPESMKKIAAFSKNKNNPMKSFSRIILFTN